MAAQLPAGPLVRAIDAWCAARSTAPRQALDPVALLAYTRAAQEGSLTADAVDRLCAAPLRADPHDLYGDQYDRAVTAGRGAGAEPAWLDDFRQRAAAAGVPLPGEGRSVGGDPLLHTHVVVANLLQGSDGAEIVPAEQLSGRRAVHLGDAIMDNFAALLEASGHGAQLRALLGPAVDQFLDGDQDHGPDRQISG